MKADDNPHFWFIVEALLNLGCTPTCWLLQIKAIVEESDKQ